MGDEILRAWYTDLKNTLRKEGKVANRACPKCARQALTYYERTGRVLCQMCGFQVDVKM